MQTFSAIFLNQPSRNVKFKVRGICQFDVLNPCFDNRNSDVVGKHWGGGQACEACTKEAMKYKKAVQ